MLPLNRPFAIAKGCTKQGLYFIASLVLLAWSLLLAGCNTLPQSAAASSQASAQSAQRISIQTSLPNTSVGSSYRQVLSVSGGLAPYRFLVSQGELPRGLVLSSQTGSISGIPTQAGTFTFTISVTGEPLEEPIRRVGPSTVIADSSISTESSGLRAYTLTITPCTNCVTMQISPENPTVTPGGKVQFTAAVSNTSNTGVTWSASAGTISAAGLFTAPNSTSTKSIPVTATSVADNAVHASAAATISSTSVFTITTRSVPSATMAKPYSTSLTTSGGEPPYQWSIVSGSLPAGVQLNSSTGTLSGSATQSGVFSFTVRGTDGLSQSAQQALTLDVSRSSVVCGPPTYSCSRADLTIVQGPSGPPNMGNLSGANMIVTDPDFGNRIVRITDANTNPAPAFMNRTYVSASSGSADENLWNIDSTLMILQDSGTNAYPFTFNPSSMQAARMYVSSFPSTNGLQLPDSAVWSRVNSNILYTYSGTAISMYDFTNRTTPPSPQPVYDFTSSRNCLPAGFTETWKTKAGVNGDDTVFGMGYSNTGIQGTGVYAVAYKVGSGCTVLNTQTGQVGGDWGAKGTINIPDRWTIHNVKMSKDGNFLIITATSCLSATCGVSPYFWQIGTTNVSFCGQGGSCGGHYTEGYTHWVNNDNSPMSNQVIRSFAQVTSVSYLTNSFPPAITPPFDQHQSWNNVDPADTVPFLSSTWSSTTPFPAPWYNEIIAVAADGSGKTWRFAHSFITAQSQSFSTLYGIGSVSQDGRFFIFSSDWMGKLGSESGAATCTIGTDCRGDVFVVELR